jgi:predicted  nucleic acid-binding Zn-ribbon protein
MPHTCTRCNNVFDSGEDILKGCPVCGWKKFMFVHERSVEKNEKSQEPIITKAMGVRIPPRKATDNENDPIIDAPIIKNQILEAQAREKSSNDSASRSAIVPGKIPAENSVITKKCPEKDTRIVESIKITGPGTYELNLPTLFERDELVMAVKDGTYFIDLSSAFKKNKKD